MKFALNSHGGWIVPVGTVIPINTIIPQFSELGNECALGKGCRLGYECVWLGIKVIRFVSASNIDGSGRQVKFVTDGESVVVEAGCFVGSVDEFVARAEREQKSFYARLVPIIANELLMHAKKEIKDASKS